LSATAEEEAQRVLHQLQRHPHRAEALLKELLNQRGAAFAQQVRGILDACRVPPGLTRKQALAFIRATKFRRPKELR
jgi:hypothetical protein